MKTKRILGVLLALVFLLSLLPAAALAAEAVDLPYSYDFSDTAELDKWTVIKQADNTGIKSIDDNSVFAFHWVTGSENYQHLITPELNTADVVSFAFRYRAENSSWPETFRVGYSTASNDVDDFTWGDAVKTYSTEWEDYSQTLPTGTKYVAIRHESYDMYYLDIDDISITVGASSDSVTVGGAADHWSTYIPVNTYYKYGETQTVVSWTELSALSGKSITGLSYYVAEDEENISVGASADVQIILTETGSNSLDGGFVSVSAADAVFSGEVSIPKAGEMHVTFDEPFAYSGGSLLVTVLNNTGSYSGKTYFVGVEPDYNASVFHYRDNSPFDSSDPGAEGTATDFLPKMTFTTAEPVAPEEALITEVDVGPVNGANPTAVTVPDDAPYVIETAYWVKSDGRIQLTSSDTFEGGEKYFIHVSLKPKAGYSFPDDFSGMSSVKLGGSAEVVDTYWSTISGDGILTIYSIDYAVPYSVKVAPGEHMTLAEGSGDAAQTVAVGEAMTDVLFDAETGYCFPKDYAVDEESGVSVTRVSETQIKVSGTPTADVTITLPAATEKEHTIPIVIEPEPEPVPKPALPFTDVSEDMPCYDDVKYVYEKGIMNGVSETLFAPEEPLLRCMIVTILYRLEGEPEIEYSGTFTDVPDGEWYSAGVEWAASVGIVLGYGDGTFGVADDVSREQLAAILHRYAVWKGYDVSVGEDTNILSYGDAFDIDEWAMPAMQWACGAEIYKEDADGNIRPFDAVSRAEIANAIHVFMEKVAK